MDVHATPTHRIYTVFIRYIKPYSYCTVVKDSSASQMGGVYDVIEISMISRGMTVQSLVIRSLDDIIHAISRVRYPVRVRYRSRDISHRGDVAAAISGLGEGYLCCVLYVFIPLIYDFRNERHFIKGASHSTVDSLILARLV